MLSIHSLLNTTILHWTIVEQADVAVWSRKMEKIEQIGDPRVNLVLLYRWMVCENGESLCVRAYVYGEKEKKNCLESLCSPFGSVDDSRESDSTMKNGRFMARNCSLCEITTWWFAHTYFNQNMEPPMADPNADSNSCFYYQRLLRVIDPETLSGWSL